MDKGDDFRSRAGSRLGRREIDEAGDWSAAAIEASLRSMLEELGLNPRKGLQPLRVAVTGSTVSPPLFESMEVLGRDRILDRMGKAGRASLTRPGMGWRCRGATRRLLPTQPGGDVRLL